MELEDASVDAGVKATDISVFINCPFDKEYEHLMDAVVFAVACCGFAPRIATDTGSVAEPRIERICAALHDSGYSIHDLSRCMGEGEKNLARFNMPLELGIAMGRRFATQESSNPHDWLVLVPEDHTYVKFISDLAGFDPKTHDGSAESIVPAVMSWLLTGGGPAVRSVEPPEVLAALPRYEAARRQLYGRWVKTDPPWRLVLAEAHAVMRQIWAGHKQV